MSAVQKMQTYQVRILDTQGTELLRFDVDTFPPYSVDGEMRLDSHLKNNTVTIKGKIKEVNHIASLRPIANTVNYKNNCIVEVVIEQPTTFDFDFL
jgi:hypothetical protein